MVCIDKQGCALGIFFLQTSTASKLQTENNKKHKQHFLLMFSMDKVAWIQVKDQCVRNNALCKQYLLVVNQFYTRSLAQKRLIHKSMLTHWKVLSIKRGEIVVCACQLPTLRWIQLFTKGHTTSLLKACHCVSSYPGGQRYCNQQQKKQVEILTEHNICWFSSTSICKLH